MSLSRPPSRSWGWARTRTRTCSRPYSIISTTRPGVFRHEWQPGDLVVWDNRLLQHARGTVDLEGPARTLRKVVGPMSLSAAERVKPKFSKVSGT